MPQSPARPPTSRDPVQESLLSAVSIPRESAELLLQRSLEENTTRAVARAALIAQVAGVSPIPTLSAAVSRFPSLPPMLLSLIVSTHSAVDFPLPLSRYAPADLLSWAVSMSAAVSYSDWESPSVVAGLPLLVSAVAPAADADPWLREVLPVLARSWEGSGVSLGVFLADVAAALSLVPVVD